jgi:hypothetical protein
MSPRPLVISLLVMIATLLAPALLVAQPKLPVPLVTRGPDRQLAYTSDERGNRVPDFSHAGYRGGDVLIPDVPIKLVVAPPDGDATALLQAAIDRVASLPPDDDGFRGAVLLRPGRFDVAGQLRLTVSGVVVRGSGFDADTGTTVVATGTDRRTLFVVRGLGDRSLGTEHAVRDDYVPVGATSLTVASGHGLKVGDAIAIRRPSTQEWINLLGMNAMGGERHGFSWKPGSRDITWERVVTAVEGDTITFDAPITTALDASLGGGTVARITWPGRIARVGIENLRLESAHDPARPLDEEHAWYAVTLQNVRDAWVRRVTALHFVGGTVAAWEGASRVSVEDSRYLAPVGENGGGRRNAFFITGQQILVQRCHAEQARHAFAAGFTAPGPNAFVQCSVDDARADSGPVDSWVSGLLMDNVKIDGGAIRLSNRSFDRQGAGWSAANCVLWKCQAAVIENHAPPGATNWAIGTWAQFEGNGIWHATNDDIEPTSLYYAQLAERVGPSEGPSVLDRAFVIEPQHDASSSPSVETAAKIVASSLEPAMTVDRWIDHVARQVPLDVDPKDAPVFDRRDVPAAAPVAATKQLKLVNGWLTMDGQVVVGGRSSNVWWSGGQRPADLQRARAAITRFVPGRDGPGLTDDLGELTDQFASQNVVAFEQHPPLWYDRRRDDHQRIRRMDGNVQSPFYEMPWARGGDGVAFDGLSRYDLTRFNPWYWNRLRTFARLGEQKGLVLVHQQYFQHNILEAGAHWADYPWRSANNVNGTGFPEPPPYAGDKRIFMAGQFYDLSHSTRVALHRAYIRQCLDALAGQANVLQLIGEEFTGPLHFVQFWIDTIADWQRTNSDAPLIVLSTTKDVQDAILADADRAKVLDAIDIRYWWYQQDGSAYAPQGGQNLAPRQHARVLKPKPTSFAQVLRAVREYRLAHPGRAVLFSADGSNDHAWAVLMGGGSMASVPRSLDAELLRAIPTMTPVVVEAAPEQGTLRSDRGDWLVYVAGPEAVIPLGGQRGHFTVTEVDPRSGRTVSAPNHLAVAGEPASIPNPRGDAAVVLWLRKQ